MAEVSVDLEAVVNAVSQQTGQVAAQLVMQVGQMAAELQVARARIAELEQAAAGTKS